MEIKDETFPDVTFEEFCEANDIEVAVRERPKTFGEDRYYATCDSVYIKGADGAFTTVLGNGGTKDIAVSAYGTRLLGEMISLNVGKTCQKESQCPNVWKSPQ
jgi:hypothetical protein